MFRRNKKHEVTPHMKFEIEKAVNQQKLASEELEEAKTLASHLKAIREENHFTQDFRVALGLRNGN